MKVRPHLLVISLQLSTVDSGLTTAGKNYLKPLVDKSVGNKDLTAQEQFELCDRRAQKSLCVSTFQFAFRAGLQCLDHWLFQH